MLNSKSRTIVSVPVDISSLEDQSLKELLPKRAVEGHYVSVERVMELENGDVEWRVVTSSSPGGKIPNFIVNSTMAKTIARVSNPLLALLAFKT